MNLETRMGYYLLLVGGCFFCIAQTEAPSTSAQVANLNSVGPFDEPDASCTPTPTPSPTATPSMPTPTCTATPVITCAVVTPTPGGGLFTRPLHCGTASWPTATPTITPIPEEFQPPDRNGLPLAWRPFEPRGNPTPPWPTILVIHGGGYWRGSPFPDAADETQNIIDVANDLAHAGYYVLVVAYRLAPSGLIPGQVRQDDAHDPNHISGFAPYQEYDVESLVKAARRDPHARGRKVGIIGGSAGATHAIWAALDTREDDPGVWPEWKPVYRPDAAVAISGVYDFSDRTPEDYSNWPEGGDPVETVRKNVENYTLTSHPVRQHNLSPVHLLELDTFDAAHVNPMQIYNTRHDNVPYHQIIDLQCALQAAGVSPQRYTITTLTDEEHGICESHSFGYWGAVKDRVIEFFNQHVKQ